MQLTIHSQAGGCELHEIRGPETTRLADAGAASRALFGRRTTSYDEEPKTRRRQAPNQQPDSFVGWGPGEKSGDIRTEGVGRIESKND